MERLKHKFKNEHEVNAHGNYVGYSEECIYCGKPAGVLFNELSEKIIDDFPNNGNNGNNINYDNYKEQANYLRKHTFCITYDEYIIKSIIE